MLAADPTLPRCGTDLIQACSATRAPLFHVFPLDRIPRMP